MKVLIINGSPHINGNTAKALKEMENIFSNENIEFETIVVGNKEVRGCIACGSCYKNGKCWSHICRSCQTHVRASLRGI